MIYFGTELQKMLIFLLLQITAGSLVFVYHLYLQHIFSCNYATAASRYLCEAGTEEGRVPRLCGVPERKSVWHDHTGLEAGITPEPQGD